MHIEPRGALNRAGESAPHTRQEQALRRACQDFEAVFIRQLLSSARLGEAEEGLFESGVADEIMWEMHNSHLAEDISRRKGFGLGAMLFAQLRKAL